MQTERVSAALRVRSGWEAIDLGFRMVRAWWMPVFASWILVVWPLALAIQLVLAEYPTIALLVIWWLKPLYDRVVLAVVSEGLFGHVPGVRETLRALPGQLGPGLVSSLTWLRFSFLRSFHLPVSQLERQRGRARTIRARVLTGRDSRTGVALHVGCLHLEAAVWIGLVQAVSWLQPEPVTPQQWDWTFGWLETTWLQNGLYVLAMTWIEPFYVGAGFGLYINRRVYLEGWDIDLVFRKLARRLALPAGVVLATALLCLLALPVRADETEIDCPPEPAAAKECSGRILASDEFSTTRELRYWWPRGWDDEEEDEVELSSSAWITLVRALAEVLRAVAWLAALAVLGWILLLVLRRGFGSAASPEREAESAAEIRLGLDVRPESLPEDLIAAARAAWAGGRRSHALSLLYRGALVHLIHDVGVALPESATEGECERIARRHTAADLSGDFSELTRAWLYCAYGDEAPGADTFERLCQRWAPRLGAQT